MEISPEILALITSGPVGLYVVGQLLSRYFSQKLNSIDDVPSLVMDLKYIKESVTKLEIQLTLLNEKKEESARRVVVLEEKTKAAHKRLDRLEENAKAY